MKNSGFEVTSYKFFRVHVLYIEVNYERGHPFKTVLDSNLQFCGPVSLLLL